MSLLAADAVILSNLVIAQHTRVDRHLVQPTVEVAHRVSTGNGSIACAQSQGCSSVSGDNVKALV